MTWQQDVQEAQAFLTGLDARPTADPGQLDGYALKWSSIANGEKGATRFDVRAFGGGPLKVPVLWAHDQQRPIGVVTVSPDQTGLRVRGRISDTAQGRDAVELIRSGASTGLSIGFDVVKSHRGDDRVRVVDLAKLHEVSVVVFPADSAARVDSVGGEPVMHAAPPHERLSRSAHDLSDMWDAIGAAEADLARLAGTSTKPEPVRGRWDFLRGRELTRDEHEAQRRSRELLDLYESNGMSPWLRAVASARGRRR